VTGDRHGRLPWPTPDQLGAAARGVYDQITAGIRAGRAPAYRLLDQEGRLEGPFNAMLLNPEVGDRVERLGSALRSRSTLPARCRELAILVVAADQRSDFEWYAHELVGLQAGLTAAELAELRDGREPASLSTQEWTVRRTALALTTAGDLDDELFEQARAELGLAWLDQVVTLVGYYQLLALSLRVWRTPLPDGVPAPFAGSNEQLT